MTRESSSLDRLETSLEFLTAPNACQLKLHAASLKTRERIITALGTSNEETLVRRAFALHGCCQNPVIGIKSSGELAIQLFTCKDRLCPRCQRARGIQCAAKVASLARNINAPRLLTFTQAAKAEPLCDAFGRLVRSFRELRKTPAWKAHVNGGVYAIETVLNLNTLHWHVHVHVIADGSFWAQKSMSDTWRVVTGDSFICDARAVPDRAAAAKYVAAYVAKPAQSDLWPLNKICEYARELQGKRLINTFGTAHGQGVDPELIEEPKHAIDPILTASAFRKALSKENKNAETAVPLLMRAGRVFHAFAGTTHVNPARDIASHFQELDSGEWQTLTRLLQQVKLDVEQHDARDGYEYSPRVLPAPRLWAS